MVDQQTQAKDEDFSCTLTFLLFYVVALDAEASLVGKHRVWGHLVTKTVVNPRQTVWGWHQWGQGRPGMGIWGEPHPDI